MPNHGQELASIDFGLMMGAPLIAAVNAQSQAAMSTINFIKEVGFRKPQGNNTNYDPIYVSFNYDKEIKPFEPAIPATATANGVAVPAVPAQFQTHKLEVPILAMLQVPSLRIEEVNIAFKAKIDSVQYQKLDTSLNIGITAEAQAGSRWGSAKLNVSCSYQRNTQEGETTTRTYSLDVTMKAVQDEMPAGLSRVLNILEESMRSQPVA